MKLYDQTIQQILALIAHATVSSLPIVEETAWPDAGDYNLVLKHEMAYELGSGTLPAISSLLVTSSDLIAEDKLLLLGPDLPDIKQDTPFARITLLHITDEKKEENNEIYNAIRKMEFTRYHVHPAGYMSRISAASERERVRVSKRSLADGLTFSKVGSLFLSSYHKHPDVLHATILFITDPSFPYECLHDYAMRASAITSSLDHIFNTLAMDCSVCNLKEVCDEVEGLKELHFAHQTTINTKKE